MLLLSIPFTGTRIRMARSRSSFGASGVQLLVLFFLIAVQLFLPTHSVISNNKHPIPITNMDNNNNNHDSKSFLKPNKPNRQQSSSSNLSMLELSTRPWLYYLSQKYNSNITALSQIPDVELQEIASKNYDYVWFMGVWHLGPYGLNHDRTDPGLLASYKQVLPGTLRSCFLDSIQFIDWILILKTLSP